MGKNLLENESFELHGHKELHYEFNVSVNNL
jgi:hypothetical protein